MADFSTKQSKISIKKQSKTSIKKQSKTSTKKQSSKLSTQRIASKTRTGIYYTVKTTSPKHCNCPKWKYQKLAPALRSCPHIQSRYAKQAELNSTHSPDFFLVANQPPRSLDNIQFYRWSRKLDGIRICINGFENAITRNGIILQLPNLATLGHHETTKLDAELIYKNDDETSYSNVTANLHDFTKLYIRPFSVFSNTLSFQESTDYLQKYVPSHITQHEFPSEASKNPMKWIRSFVEQHPHFEGIVVRHLNESVIYGGRRAKACFKYKLNRK